MDLYKILLIVLIVLIAYFTYTRVTSNSSNTLTEVTATDVEYVVTPEMITAISSDTVYNYAISIWLYIDKWALTLHPKLVLTIPNTLTLNLGHDINNLNVLVYNTSEVSTEIGGGTPGYSINDIGQLVGPGNKIYELNAINNNFTDSSGIIMFTVNSNGDIVDINGNVIISGYITPTIDTPQTCPGDVVSGSTDTCCDIKIGGLTTSMAYDATGLAANTVYQNINNKYEYTFVYKNRDNGNHWDRVEVWFIRPALANPTNNGDPPVIGKLPSGVKLNSSITSAKMTTGTPYDGFLLESHASIATGESIKLKSANTDTSCNWQKYVTRKFPCRSTTGQCTTTPQNCEDLNPPSISLIQSQYNSCLNLKSITYKLDDSAYYNYPYFNPTNSKNLPYFQFVYYDNANTSNPTIIQPPTKLIVGPSVLENGLSAFTNPNSMNMLYTPSSLLGGIYDNHLLSNLYGKSNRNMEGLIVVPPSIFTGVITNLPLQKWVNVVVNVNGKALDLYMNGKLEQTYIMPGVAAPMGGDKSITVAGANSFVGYTSKLQYYPNTLNPKTVWDIYQEGYSKRPSIFSILSQYSVKLIFVNNSPKK